MKNILPIFLAIALVISSNSLFYYKGYQRGQKGKVSIDSLNHALKKTVAKSDSIDAEWVCFMDSLRGRK